MDHMLDIRLTFVKKSGFFVLWVIVGAFFCINTPLAQERSQNPYSPLNGRWIGWEGWITISHDKELTQIFEPKPGSAGSGESRYREEFHADEKIDACCCGYNSIKPVSNITTLNHYRVIDSLSYFQYDKAVCDAERTAVRTEWPKPKVMQPGDSIRKEIDHTETKAENEEGKHRVEFWVSPDGKYHLFVYTDYFVERISDQIETEEWVCKGENKITKSETRPGGLQERTTIYSTNQSTISHDGPRLINLLGFNGEVTINGNVIEGEATPISKKSTEPYFKQWKVHEIKFREKVNNGHEEQVVKFNIKLKDGCTEVIEQVKNEDAFIKAYNDFTLADLSLGNIKRYQDLATNRAYQIGLGFYPAKTEDQIEKIIGQSLIDIAPDFEKCKIKDLEEFLKQQKKICQPGVLVKFRLKHENTHVDQCNDYKNRHIDPLIATRNIEHFRKGEIEAFCAGMKVLLNWLDDRPWCNFDTRPYRELCKTSSR